jgi:hypothetical protein
MGPLMLPLGLVGSPLEAVSMQALSRGVLNGTLHQRLAGNKLLFEKDSASAHNRMRSGDDALYRPSEDPSVVIFKASGWSKEGPCCHGKGRQGGVLLQHIGFDSDARLVLLSRRSVHLPLLFHVSRFFRKSSVNSL